jgi:hypothetical protein
VAQFVQEYAALRWSVVVAFLLASGIVVMRLTTPAREFGPMRLLDPAGVRGSAGDPGGARRGDAPGGPGTGADISPAVEAGSLGSQANSSPNGATYHESDAAHLMMCLVMLAMLVFPSGANPHALRGVLVAMTVAFAALLVCRMVEWCTGNRALSVDRMVTLGYHVVATVAMLYAMSGHGASGHSGGPAPVPACGLAALFLADALGVIVVASSAARATSRWGRTHWLGHRICARTGSVDARAVSSAVLPHVVMDIGMAYMLIAAVSG